MIWLGAGFHDLINVYAKEKGPDIEPCGIHVFISIKFDSVFLFFTT